MTDAGRTALRIAQACYLGLVAWQVLARVPQEPAEPVRWLPALLFLAPLLLPLPGVMRGELRPRVWAGFLAVAYFVLGVLQAWGAPAWWWVQPGLAAAYVLADFTASRSR